MNFNKEIKTIKNLPNNNYTPKIYDSKEYEEIKNGEDYIAEKPYYAIDLFSKGSLFYYASSKLLSEKRHTKLMFKKIVEGVKFLHSQKICHLDLKLENIILDKNFDPIIIDFGSSEEFDEPNHEIMFDNNKRMTKYYISPEIFEGNNFDGVRADIFSLGVILFKLVTGGYGFVSSKKDNYLYSLIRNSNGYYEEYWNSLKQTYNKLKKENQINLKFSDKFKKLFVKMVAYKPSERPTINEILNDPWLEEINELCKDENEKDKLELELKEEFSKLYEIIKYKDNEIQLAEEIIKKGYNTRSPETKEKGIFQNIYIKIKEISDDRELINNFIKINGALPYNYSIDFMNELSEEIFNDLKGVSEASQEYLKFKVTFEKNEFEENDEYENYEMIIDIELFKYKNGGYLLEFLRLKGEIEDYYHYFLEIKKIIKKLLKFYLKKSDLNE